MHFHGGGYLTISDFVLRGTQEQLVGPVGIPICPDLLYKIEVEYRSMSNIEHNIERAEVRSLMKIQIQMFTVGVFILFLRLCHTNCVW